MALPSTNISTSLVGNTLDTSSRDVGTLCTHPSINKWSKYKPVPLNKTSELTDADLISVSCGLDRNPQTQVISYIKPRGGAYNEPYRLGDFRNYNHLAVPPVNVVIVGVNGGPLTGGTVTTPPFILIFGFDYNIHFKLVPGDIDPLWINPQTSRVKNTDSAGGYGGLTWMIGPNLPEQERLPSEVFTCEYLDGGPTYTQKITARSGDLRVQYCYYKGSTINKYGTTPHYIEDDGFSNSYRSLFSLRNVSAGISSAAFLLSKVSTDLEVRLNIFNNEAYNLNVKIKLQYKRIETGITYNLDSGAFTLTAGYNSTKFLQPIEGWSNGFNSYEIKAWMYIVKPDLTEVEISYQMQTASITISSGG